MQMKKSLKELYYSKHDNNQDLEKAGLKDKIKAGLVAGSSMLFSPSTNVNTDKPPQSPAIEAPSKQLTPPKPKKDKPVFGEAHLLEHAQKAGLQGKELAAFMGQMAHETLNFTRSKEIISQEKANKRYKGGAAFLGRGYAQLSHNFNYEKYGDLLGIDLLNNPHLAEEPDIAAKIALTYWKTQVSPKVKDWDDVFYHSRLINRPTAKNPSQINGYQDRVNKYNLYLDKFKIPRAQQVAEKSMQDYVNETLYKSLQEVKKQGFQDIVDEILYKSLNEVIKKR